MGYGLYVLSANGSLQIDSDQEYRTLYQVVASGTSSTITGASGSVAAETITWGTTIVTPSTWGNDSIVVIKPSVTYAGQIAFALWSGTGFTIYSDTNIAYNYRILEPATGITFPTNNYGLEVYDSSGNILFSNASSTSRLADTLGGAGTSATGTGLYAMPQYVYQRIRARTSGTSGDGIWVWGLTFNSNGSITHSAVWAFDGPVVTDPEDVINFRWNNSYNPSTLISK